MNYISNISFILLFIISCGVSNGTEHKDILEIQTDNDLITTDMMPEDNAGEEDFFPEQAEFFQDADTSETQDTGGKEIVNVLWQQLGVPFPKEYVFRSIYGFDELSIFLAGAGGVVYKYDSQNFESLFFDPQFPMINGIWGSAQDDLWIVGISGKTLHYGKEKIWSSSGVCKKDDDCKTSDPCIVGICGQGQCSFIPASVEGCCGFPSLNMNFDDSSLQGLTIEDIYNGQTDKGGIVWQVFSHVDPVTSEPRWTSPSYSLYFGIPTKACTWDNTKICPDFNNGKTVGSTATTPAFKLPKADEITLKFMLFFDGESGYPYDNISVNLIDGESKIQVWDKKSLSGGTTNKKFVPVEADLSKYQDKDVKLQFLFDSVDMIANQYEGIYIDDIVIDSKCGEVKGEEFPTLFDVYGSSPDDIYAVGLYGTVVHYNGTKWTKILGGKPPDFRDVCGNGNILVVGDGGAIYELKGGILEKKASEIQSNLIGCDEGSFITGENGTYLVSDGGVFKAESVVQTGVKLEAVSKSDDGTIFIVGEKGTALRIKEDKISNYGMIANGTDLHGVYAYSASGAIAVGDSGYAAKFTGTMWITLQTPGAKKLLNVHGISEKDIYIVGRDGLILQYDGKNFTVVQSPSTANLNDVYMAGSGDIFIAGLGGEILFKPSSSDKFQKMESPAVSDLYGIYGKSASEVYAAGSDGTILYYDGTSWKQMFMSTANHLRGVFALNKDLVFIAGDKATILKFDGKSWSKETIDKIKLQDGTEYEITDDLNSIFAFSSQDVWAVGANGVILHSKGGNFEWQGSESSKTLRSVRGIAKDKLWAAGGEGTILHFNGTQWKQEISGSIATLFDLWGSSEKNLIVVGDLGTVLKRK